MAVGLEDWVGLELCGRYRVDAKLGEGGMGAVFRAHDQRLQTDVVIKVPRRELLTNREFVERFRQEIGSLVRLTHPHIVKITDADSHDGVPFAVMQFLAGGSLESRRPYRQGRWLPVEPQALAAWMPQVARALDFLHGQGFVHRDVKPANILFDAHDNAYLGDFGVVKALAAQEKTGRDASLTGTGLVLGTPNYMAPELVMGQAIDGRVDQYALAVVVYEMLCGRRPFEAEAPSALLVMHTTQPPPSPLTLAPGLRPSLVAAILRGLAKAPTDRFRTCDEFAQAVLGTTGAAVVGSVAPVAKAARTATGAAGAVPCPSCGKVLPTKPKHAGKRVACPGCQAVLRVSADLTTLTEDPAAAAKLTSRRAENEEYALAAGGSAPERGAAAPAATISLDARLLDTQGIAGLPTPAGTLGSVALKSKLPPQPSAPTVPWRWIAAGGGVLGVLLVAVLSALLVGRGSDDRVAVDNNQPPAIEPAASQPPVAPPSSASVATPASSQPSVAPPPPAVSLPTAAPSPVQSPPVVMAAAPPPVDRQPSIPTQVASQPQQQASESRPETPAQPSQASAILREQARQSGYVTLSTGALAMRSFSRDEVQRQWDGMAAQSSDAIPTDVDKPSGVVRLQRGGRGSLLGYASYRDTKLHGPAVACDENQIPVLALTFQDGEQAGQLNLVEPQGGRLLSATYGLNKKGRSERTGTWCYWLDDQPVLLQQFLSDRRKSHLLLADRVVESVDLDGPPGDVPLPEWRRISQAKDSTDELLGKLVKQVENSFEAKTEPVRNFRQGQRGKQVRANAKARQAENLQRANQDANTRLKRHLQGQPP